MTNRLQNTVRVAMCALAFGGLVRAQEPTTAPPQARTSTTPLQAPLVPVKVQLVISRYQGEKKISSLPYTLSVIANDRSPGNNQAVRSSLRMGAQVAMTADGKPGGPVQYKDIGTNIDCDARSLDDGRFRLNVSIQDTSVYADGQVAQGAPRLSDIPTFRSFNSSETLILKDGQTAQYTAAADKISGEVTRVDVTLTVVK